MRLSAKIPDARHLPLIRALGVEAVQFRKRLTQLGLGECLEGPRLSGGFQ